MNAQQLRASILQMAIEGRLVPQDPNDKPVEIDAKDIVPEEEQPFTIPENWYWMKLKDIFTFVDYRGKTPKKTSSGIRLMTASNVKKGYIDHSREEYISEEEYMSRQSRGVSKKGDILFTTEAPLGNAAIADLDLFSAGQRVITLKSEKVKKSLFVYFLISPFFQQVIKENATGTTAQGIKAATLKELYLPIPPLAEQKRIVTRIEELMPLVETYGEAQEHLEKLDKELPNRMKQSILQTAIQGKLVPQDPNDKPVEIDSKDVVLEEEQPFAIPENWRWVKLSSIATKLTDGTHKSPPNTGNGDYLYITAKNIKNTGIDLSNITYVTKDIHELIYARCNPEQGDILFIKDGATTGVVTINQLDVPFSMLSSVALIKTNQVNKYIVFAMRSPYFFDSIRGKMKGAAITRVTLKILKNCWIPLPPLAEQKRIVNYIEKFFNKIDEIK